MGKKMIYDSGASETIVFAAEELAAYLCRMLPEGDVPAIRLGVSGELPQEMDSYRVRVTEEGGAIVGCNDRSVLLGVYDYLHRLGCRFLGPGKACEVIPVIPPQALPASYERKASFHHRGVCIEGANSLENVLDFIDWLPKLGYNSFFLQFKIPYTFLARWYHHERNTVLEPEAYSVADAAKDMETMETAIRRRSLMLHKVGHGWTGETLGYETVAWQPDGQPLAKEKEHLAAQVDGKRGLFGGIPANTNLCYHNGDAVERFASLVVDYAQEHPSVDYLHIWLADTYNNLCECGDCRETTLSDQYVALLNEIDRRLTEKGLGTKLVFLLYQELLWPPVREKLIHPERFVLMFAPISRTFESSYDLDGPEAEIPVYPRNQVKLPTGLPMNLAFLKGWQKLFAGDSFVYDYPLGRAHYGDFGYVHIARIINSDIKKLRQMGLDGYISCQELRVCLPNALPNYVMGYTLFDETAHIGALVEEYFVAAYGAGAAEAQAHLSELSRLSSCDYLNGKNERVNPDMADRLEKIRRVCEDFAPVWESRSAGENGPLWKVLGYHNSCIRRLAEAMRHIALGEPEKAGEAWLAFQQFISEHESEYQPYLDVYRILEVTSNYTGFLKAVSQYRAAQQLE